jgi:hypothetical protein
MPRAHDETGRNIPSVIFRSTPSWLPSLPLSAWCRCSSLSLSNCWPRYHVALVHIKRTRGTRGHAGASVRACVVWCCCSSLLLPTGGVGELDYMGRPTARQRGPWLETGGGALLSVERWSGPWRRRSGCRPWHCLAGKNTSSAPVTHRESYPPRWSTDTVLADGGRGAHRAAC